MSRQGAKEKGPGTMKWKSPAVWIGIAGACGAIVGLAVTGSMADQAIGYAEIVGTAAGVVVSAATAFVAAVRKAREG